MHGDGQDATPFGPPSVSSSPPPPPPPTFTPDRWPTVEDAMAGMDRTGQIPLDDTVDQPESTIVRGGGRGFGGRGMSDRLISEDTFQTVRRHLARSALAALLALPIALAVFVGWSAVRFAGDDRTFGSSLAHSLSQFWFVLLLFVVTVAPATYVLLRDGGRESWTLVTSSRYRRLLVAVLVVLPVAATLIAFVIGHLVIVLLVLLAILILLAVNGGF